MAVVLYWDGSSFEVKLIGHTLVLAGNDIYQETKNLSIHLKGEVDTARQL